MCVHMVTVLIGAGLCAQFDHIGKYVLNAQAWEQYWVACGMLTDMVRALNGSCHMS